MSKAIKFNVLLSVNGKKQLVEAQTATEELRKRFEGTRREALRTAEAFLRFNQGLEAVHNLADGVRQLGDSLRATADKNRMLTQLTGETGAGMRDLRGEVQAVADYFGKDFGEVLRSANALAKGFGISAREAMALVRDGLVSGADAGGDFLDTVREYPRYFKEAGLSAEDFIAISTNAAKQGVYSDKGVDAIKEGNLRIREMTTATAAALEGIGISSEAVQEGLRDGSLTTFEVMQQVAARLKELPPSASQVGAALADIFGGPGEDAGLEYIKSLADVELSMGNVKAASGGLAEQQEAAVRAQEKFNFSLQDYINLAGVYAQIKPFVGVAADVGSAVIGIKSITDALKGFSVQAVLARVRVAAVTVATAAATAAQKTATAVTLAWRGAVVAVTAVQAVWNSTSRATAVRLLALAAAQKVVRVATAAWAAVQKVLNWVLRANPIGLVITAIGVLVAAVVAAYNRSERFREVVDKLWASIKPLADAVGNVLAGALEWLAEKAKAAWDWLANLLGLSGKKVEMAVEVKEKSKPGGGGKIDLSGSGRKINLPGDGEKVDLSGVGSAVAGVSEAPAALGSIDWYEGMIRSLREQMNATADMGLARELQNRVEMLQSALGDLKIRIGIDKPEETAAAARELTQRIGDDFAAWKEENPLQPLDMEDDEDRLAGMRKGLDKVGKTAQATGQMFGALGEAFEQPAFNIMGTIAQAVATLALTFASSLKGTVTPWDWIAAAAAGTATLISTIASIRQATAFAEGGIVSGPTYALVGEYAGARNNPEVIAPLNKLRSLIEPQRGFEAGQVRFEIEGRTLVGILEKVNRLSSRR